MSLLCPRCRVGLSVEAPICPEHTLHGVAPDALARTDDAPLLGYVIDRRFALIDYIGGGGMGAVYKAKQLSVDRVVAVKVLHASLTATREDRQRFEDEARAISRLQSSHTVTLYDFGLVREGPLCNLAFMVLEYVEGETLTRRIRREGPMSPATVLGILEGLADALDEAHAHGIVHRDLKPANILLSYDHRGLPKVKVIDFGVARMGDASHLTQTGFSVGTPSYMAPEQFDSTGSEGIDGRADVYALGVVTWLLLTGKKPFISKSVLELGRMHRQDPPPALPATVSHAAQVQRVLHRALAKHPAARFATVGAFARALGAAIEGADPSFSDVAIAQVPAPAPVPVPMAIPIALVGADDRPTPTESFVGMLGEPERHRRRRWLPLALIVGFGGLAGTLLAMAIIAPDPLSLPDPGVASMPRAAQRTTLTPPLDAPETTAAATPPSVAARPASGASSAPVTAAPSTAAPTPRPRTVKARPVKARPVKARASLASAAPATAAEQPPARRPRPKASTTDARVPGQRARIASALAGCRCRQARAAFAELETMRGSAAAARRVRAAVQGCLVPDVDEICVNGKVQLR